MRKQFAALFAALAVIALLPSKQARAADLGGNCCADLEERIRELEATTVRKGNRQISLTVSGWVLAQQGGLVSVAIDPFIFSNSDAGVRLIQGNVQALLSASLEGALQEGAPAPSNGPMYLGAGSGDGGPSVRGTSLWFAGLGGGGSFEAGLSDADERYAGGLAGVQTSFAPGWTGGAYIGGARGTLEPSPSLDLDTDYFLAGVYGRYATSPLFVDFALMGGWSSNDSSRYQIRRTATSTTNETVVADYNGRFISPAIGLGVNVPIGGGALLIPSIKARADHYEIDGYTETGSLASLTVSSRSLTAVEERAQLEIKQTYAMAGGSALTLSAHIGALFYQRTGDDNLTVTALAIPLTFTAIGRDHEEGIVGGAAFSYQSTPGTTLFGEVEAFDTQSARAVTGSAGLKVNF